MRYTDFENVDEGQTSRKDLVKSPDNVKTLPHKIKPESEKVQEKDPNGKSPHESGSKLDAGKLFAGLVIGDFSYALEEVCRVGTFGAQKYTKSGWIHVPDGLNRYTDAFHRHLLKHNQGETHDPETGLTHWAHICWNALAIMELWKRKAITKPDEQEAAYKKEPHS